MSLRMFKMSLMAVAAMAAVSLLTPDSAQAQCYGGSRGYSSRHYSSSHHSRTYTTYQRSGYSRTYVVRGGSYGPYYCPPPPPRPYYYYRSYDRPSSFRVQFGYSSSDRGRHHGHDRHGDHRPSHHRSHHRGHWRR